MFSATATVIYSRSNASDIAIFYNSASELERREMEAASASVGRVPMKTASGLPWQTLLNPEMVNEAILARAETRTYLINARSSMRAHAS